MFEISEARGGYKKTTIVYDSSLTVGEAEIVALLGRNGAGKSTLMKYAMGLIDSFGGSVSINGKTLPASTSKRVKKGLGYVPQGRFVFPRLSVSENIAAAAIACGHDKKAAINEAYVDFPDSRRKKGFLGGQSERRTAADSVHCTSPGYEAPSHSSRRTDRRGTADDH